MACERCGRDGTTLPGSPCSCWAGQPGGLDDADAWIARETLYGRWTMLSRPRKAGVALGVLLVLGGLTAAATLFLSPSGNSAASTVQSRDPEEGVSQAGPSLIVPTGAPEPTTSTGSPTPSSSAKPTPKKPPAPGAEPHPPASATALYSAWAGHGCASGANSGYTEYGRYTDGTQGWYTVDHGGFEGASCDGSYSAVPMTGSSTEDDDNAAVWWWSVGSAYATCSIGVYVPDGDSRDVGGDPTTYRVLSDPGSESSAYATFQIKQVSDHGMLVNAGTYPVKDGRIAVRMLDRGQDWNADGPTYAHHAAAQMKLTCHPNS